MEMYKIKLVKKFFLSQYDDVGNDRYCQEDHSWIDVSEAELLELESDIKLFNYSREVNKDFHFGIVVGSDDAKVQKSFIEELAEGVRREKDKIKKRKLAEEKRAQNYEALKVEKKRRQLEKLKKELGES